MIVGKTIHTFGNLQSCTKLLVTVLSSHIFEKYLFDTWSGFQLQNPFWGLFYKLFSKKTASNRYKILTKTNPKAEIKTELTKNNYINLPFRNFNIRFTRSHNIK